VFRRDRKIEGQGAGLRRRYQEQTRRVKGTLTGYWSVLVEEQSEQQGAFRQMRLSLWWSSSGNTVQILRGFLAGV